MDKTRVEQMAKALKSIAHPQRLEVLMLLGCKGKLSVGQIQKELGFTQSMTSQYLLSMKAQGVLSSIRRGNVVEYFIYNKNVLKVISCMENCGKIT